MVIFQLRCAEFEDMHVLCFQMNRTKVVGVRHSLKTNPLVRLLRRPLGAEEAVVFSNLSNAFLQNAWKQTIHNLQYQYNSNGRRIII